MGTKWQVHRHHIDYFLNFLARCYPEDWQREILLRVADDAFPPYEFWRALVHANEIVMQCYVARGIALWLEQQDEIIQDLILTYLYEAIDLTAHDRQTALMMACGQVFMHMEAQDWLSRHAVICLPNSPLWQNAMIYVINAIKFDHWEDLRNFKRPYDFRVLAGG
jgi:hypothetical protein